MALQSYAAVPGFYVGARDLDSGLHVCTSSLLIKSSPQAIAGNFYCYFFQKTDFLTSHDFIFFFIGAMFYDVFFPQSSCIGI